MRPSESVTDDADGVVPEGFAKLVALAETLVNRDFGSFAVVDASVLLGRMPDDDDAPAALLSLVLSNPKGTDTWPTEDLVRLRRVIVHDARRTQAPLALYVELSPETSEAQEDDPNDNMLDAMHDAHDADRAEAQQDS